MNSKYLITLERIREEMEFVNQSITKSEKAWQKAKISNDDSFYDSVALNLHNMYNGIERIFEQIAINVDESTPEGKNWHRDLLIQMSLNIKDIRPNVISDPLFKILDKYRSFRHVVRNIYTFQFDLGKLDQLIDHLKDFTKLLNTDIENFYRFLTCSS